jgi:PAS domain S-box-containing protein
MPNTFTKKQRQILEEPNSAENIIDMVVQEKTEEALTEREQLYQAIAESIPQIVWTADPDGTVDYFNRRWFEYTGLTELETYSGTKSAVHPEDYDPYIVQWKQAIETGQTYEMEYRFRRASDGMYRWHLGRGVPIHNSSGQVIKWIGTCTDIHDQKQFAEKVQKLNEDLEQKVFERTRELQDEILERMRVEARDQANFQRLQSVMDSMLLGAIIVDENLHIMNINTEFCRLFDIERDPHSFAGMHVEEIYRMKMPKVIDAKKNMVQLRQTLQEQIAIQNQEVRLKNGRILSRQYVPIYVDQELRGHLLMYRDVTQERRIDASKSEFMSLASHQLRTPLTAIRWIFGKLSRLSPDKFTDDERKLLTEGRNATKRMASTIDTMLAISRIEAGQVQLRLDDSNVYEILQEVREQFRESAHEKNLTLALDCPMHIFLVTDVNLLREVLRNIVSNAIKYTPEHGTITLTGTDDDSGIHIKVSDTGFGIPEDQKRRIFTKFFRGSNVVDLETEGTGLGLYLVHLIVTILGGTITFTSEERQGTTFTLLFPPVCPDASHEHSHS